VRITTLALTIEFVGSPLGCLRSAPPREPGPTQAAPRSDEQAAQAAAEEWLALNDAETFSLSWARTAQPLKQVAHDEATFARTLKASRPAGSVLSRTRVAVKHTRSWPSRPDGDYVQLRFETIFSEDGAALETVLVAKDADGQWRVAGSRIQRASPVE
jgi:hypothetical protein